MGDRFYLDLRCAYCKTNNNQVYYAPTSGFDTFKCCKCMSPNFINSKMEAIPIEDITVEMIKVGRKLYSNEQEIKRIMEEIKNV